MLTSQFCERPVVPGSWERAPAKMYLLPRYRSITAYPTDEYAAHPVFLIRKHVFDTGAHSRTRGVGGLLALRESMVADTPTMNPALVALLLELGFRLRRPVGTIGPHLVAG